MKRTQYITRLTTVGFTATELSRMSNENLHATYLEARPLLEKNAAELQKVVTREQKRSQRLRSEIAYTHDQRKSHEEYHQWSQSHLPKPIVARRVDAIRTMPQNPDAEFVSSELRKARMELREGHRDLKFRGGREAIQRVGNARKKVQVWENEMQGVTK